MILINHKTSVLTRLLKCIALALIFTACTPTRVKDTINLDVPKQWHHANSLQTNTAQIELAKWWLGFQDPTLNNLINKTLAANNDIKMAVARVKTAAAYTQMSKTRLFPSLDLGTTGGREKRIDRILPIPGSTGVQLINPTGDVVTTGLNLQWEIDLFGSIQLSTEANAARTLSMLEDSRALMSNLLAQLAIGYFELKNVGQQLKLTQQAIKVEQERLQAMQAFFRTGIVNQVEINQQQVSLHALESTLPLLQKGKENLLHGISTLMGEQPTYLENKGIETSPWPLSLPKIPNLLPASILKQRPDMRKAQAEVKAAAAMLGAAKANLFPKIMLSASGGFGAMALGGFPSLSDSVYTLGSGLTAPIFNAGRIKALIVAANADLDQAAAGYEKTFLASLEDVENAFVAYTTTTSRHKSIAEANQKAEETFVQTQKLFENSIVPIFNVFDARKNRLNLAIESTKTHTAIIISMINLYRAFGGGWSETEAEKDLAL